MLEWETEGSVQLTRTTPASRFFWAHGAHHCFEKKGAILRIHLTPVSIRKDWLHAGSPFISSTDFWANIKCQIQLKKQVEKLWDVTLHQWKKPWRWRVQGVFCCVILMVYFISRGGQHRMEMKNYREAFFYRRNGAVVEQDTMRKKAGRESLHKKIPHFFLFPPVEDWRKHPLRPGRRFIAIWRVFDRPTVRSMSTRDFWDQSAYFWRLERYIATNNPPWKIWETQQLIWALDPNLPSPPPLVSRQGDSVGRARPPPPNQPPCQSHFAFKRGVDMFLLGSWLCVRCECRFFK